MKRSENGMGYIMVYINKLHSCRKVYVLPKAEIGKYDLRYVDDDDISGLSIYKDMSSGIYYAVSDSLFTAYTA